MLLNSRKYGVIYETKQNVELATSQDRIQSYQTEMNIGLAQTGKKTGLVHRKGGIYKAGPGVQTADDVTSRDMGKPAAQL